MISDKLFTTTIRTIAFDAEYAQKIIQQMPYHQNLFSLQLNCIRINNRFAFEVLGHTLIQPVKLKHQVADLMTMCILYDNFEFYCMLIAHHGGLVKKDHFAFASVEFSQRIRDEIFRTCGCGRVSCKGKSCLGASLPNTPNSLTASLLRNEA